ncbi:MAG: site-specific integrase [Candidatus Hydrogenedentota bacterium]
MSTDARQAEPGVDRAAAQFEEHLRSERELSTHTLRAYMADLAQFCDYIRRGAAAPLVIAKSIKPRCPVLFAPRRQL